MLLGIHGKDLASPALGELTFDFFNQLALFCVNPVLRKIACVGDQKLDLALELGIELCPVKRTQAKGMIRIEEQGVKHDAKHGAIASMLLQCRPNRVLQLSVSRSHERLHGHTDADFLIRREFTRYILQKDEGAEIHQEFTEQQRRSTGLASNRARR